MAGSSAATGKVARYFDDRGYGFIAPHDGSKEVFFHCSELPENKPPKRGAPVQYDVSDGAKGKRAVKITFLETHKSTEQTPTAKAFTPTYRSFGKE